MPLALATGVVSVLFAAVLLWQFAGRRRPYQAIWAAGLAWYAIGAFSEYWGSLAGWTPTVYRLWYLAGAICVAAYLGMGVVFLLAPGPIAYVVVVALALGSLPALFGGAAIVGLVGLVCAGALGIVAWWRPARFAPMAFAILIVGTVYAAVAAWQTPLDAALLPHRSDIATGAALSNAVRLLTPLFNIVGAVVLVGGAAMSAWSFWRRRTVPWRVASNVCIAIGAFIPSIASSLTRLGWSPLFYVGQLGGVVVIFLGFMIGQRSGPRPPGQAVQPSAGDPAVSGAPRSSG